MNHDGGGLSASIYQHQHRRVPRRLDHILKLPVSRERRFEFGRNSRHRFQEAVAFRARAGVNQRERPLLELPLVQFRQRLGAAEIRGLALFLKLNLLAEGVFEPAFDEIDGEVGDINANPLPAELLRRVNGRAATAKRRTTMLRTFLLKIAQPFMAGLNVINIKSSPAGTKEIQSNISAL